MRRPARWMTLCLLGLLTTLPGYAADFFRFYAPPGGVYANASFERDELVEVTVTIEHEGVAIPSWFLAVTAGGSGVFTSRELAQGASSLSYQIYGTPPPSTNVLKAPPETLTASNVITSADFGTAAATAELVSFTLYVSLPSGQFQPSGEYTDSVSLELYTGDYADPGTHVLSDTVDVAVTGRMAQLVDIYADREPDIRSMDLTTIATNRLIATVHERSNSVTGYTVAITSANLAADTGGATVPFFAHLAGGGTLDYSLTYGGSAVGPWSGGSALVVDSTAITAPEWISRDLRISYSGSASLDAGDYEDRLVLTISAK
ncbi:MAG: spore coat protein U domain-containing protein [Spirochaetota bacterium]